jgi:uncharacterized LabA/DUF88 family protein
MDAEFPQNVLIEPSLLVAERTFDVVIERMHEYSVFGKRSYIFFVPSKFLYLLEETERNMKNIEFFANYTKMVNLNYLKDILAREEIVRKFEIQPEFREKYDRLYENLLGKTRNEVISDILFEEWVFLQEKSWVISRLKKPFNYFIKANAASIEFGKKTLDLAMRRTLKKGDKDIITNVQRLRAFGKWVAVAGPPVLALVNPIVAVMGGITGNIFLLFDP